MNHTVIPATNTHANIILYLSVCAVCIGVVGLFLFGTIRKTNPIYWTVQWVRLKCLWCCCKHKRETPEEIEERGVVLQRILDDIESINSREM